MPIFLLPQRKAGCGSALRPSRQTESLVGVLAAVTIAVLLYAAAYVSLRWKEAAARSVLPSDDACNGRSDCSNRLFNEQRYAVGGVALAARCLHGIQVDGLHYVSA